MNRGIADYEGESKVMTRGEVRSKRCTYPWKILGVSPGND